MTTLAIEPFFEPEPVEQKLYDPAKWIWGDTVLQATYTVLHVMDWTQTLHGARNPSETYEGNPIIGKYPSKGKINSYFIITLIGHTAISNYLEKPYRTLWQGIWIYYEYDTVQNNRGSGIGVNLHF